MDSQGIPECETIAGSEIRGTDRRTADQAIQIDSAFQHSDSAFQDSDSANLDSVPEERTAPRIVATMVAIFYFFKSRKKEVVA